MKDLIKRMVQRALHCDHGGGEGLCPYCCEDVPSRVDSLADEISADLPSRRKATRQGTKGRSAKATMKPGDSVKSAGSLFHTGVKVGAGESGKIVASSGDRHQVEWSNGQKGWHDESALEWDEAKHPRGPDGKFT